MDLLTRPCCGAVRFRTHWFEQSPARRLCLTSIYPLRTRYPERARARLHSSSIVSCCAWRGNCSAALKGNTNLVNVTFRPRDKGTTQERPLLAISFPQSLAKPLCLLGFALGDAAQQIAIRLRAQHLGAAAVLMQKTSGKDAAWYCGLRWEGCQIPYS